MIKATGELKLNHSPVLSSPKFKWAPWVVIWGFMVCVGIWSLTGPVIEILVFATKVLLTALTIFPYEGETNSWSDIYIYLWLFSQISLYATELFSVVNFLDDSEDTFNHLFLFNPNVSDYSIYTKNQFYFQVQHSVEQVSK